MFCSLFISSYSSHLRYSMPINQFKAWLFRVVHNRCMDELRRIQPVYFSELKHQREVEDEFVTFEFIPDPGPFHIKLLNNMSYNSAYYERLVLYHQDFV